MNMLQELSRALRPMTGRIRALVTRGRVTLVDVSKPIQGLQVDLGAADVHDRISHFQPSGLATYPREGAEAVVLFPGGNRERGIAIAVDDRRDRFELGAPGEVALFNPSSGSSVHLHEDGTIRVEGDLVVEGAVSASEDVSDAGGTLQGFRDIYDLHIHSTPAGPSGPPNPQSGGASLEGGEVDQAIAPPAPAYAVRYGSFAFGVGETYYRAYGETGDWVAYRHLGQDVARTLPDTPGPRPKSAEDFSALAYPIPVP